MTVVGSFDASKNPVSEVSMSTRKASDVRIYAHDLKQQLTFLTQLSVFASLLKKKNLLNIAIQFSQLSLKVKEIYAQIVALQFDDQMAVEVQDVEISKIKARVISSFKDFNKAKSDLPPSILLSEKETIESISTQFSLCVATVSEEIVFPLNPHKIIESASKVVEQTKINLILKWEHELMLFRSYLMSQDIHHEEQLHILSNIARLEKNIEKISRTRLKMDIAENLDAIFRCTEHCKHAPSSMVSILTNLLSNATKYGGESIILIAKLVRSNKLFQPDTVEIVIKDNGEGIVPNNLTNPSEEESEKILKEAENILFTLGQQGTNKQIGSGFGGASLIQLASRLKGTIEIFTKGAGVASGTKIIVSIPLIKECSPHLSEKRLLSPRPKYLPSLSNSIKTASLSRAIIKKKLKLVVVDDVKINRQLIKKHFLKVFNLKLRNSDSIKHDELATIHEKFEPLKNGFEKESIDFSYSHSKFFQELGDDQEGLMKSLEEIVDEGVQENRSLVLIIDKHLKQDSFQGDDVAKWIRDYIQMKYKEYKKILYISYTADAPELNELYDGYLDKQVDQSKILGVVKFALSRLKQPGRRSSVEG